MADAERMISVEADLSGPLDTLEKMGARRRTVMKRMLSQVGTAAKNEAKRAYRPVGLRKQTETLYKSIQKKVMRNGAAVIIRPGAQRDGSVLYGYALAKGAIITAKDSKWLTFQKDGKWVKVRSVRIPSHDYIMGPVGKYLKSTAFKDKVDTIMEKEIQRLEKETRK